MGKKTRKAASTAGLNHEKQVIADAFDDSVQMFRSRGYSQSKLANVHLAGGVLKRRKDSVYRMLPEIQKRYGPSYPDEEVINAWSRACACVANYTVDKADELFGITLAAAIWMLDELRSCCRLELAYDFFPDNLKNVERLSLPDFFDPCHDETVILSMMMLIYARDSDGCYNHGYLNEVTARRSKPVLHQVSEADEETMTSRERFDSVMALIPFASRQRAAKRFTEKFWEFQDILFDCDARLYRKFLSHEREMEQVLEQQMAFEEQLLQSKKLTQTPGDILLAKKPPQPFALFTKADRSPVETVLKDEIHQKMGVGKRIMKLLGEEGALIKRRVRLQRNGITAQMYSAKRVADELGEGAKGELQQLLRFEVDDPYEICFGYLCLVEENSDIPWVYNGALAVLSAAARKLPWNIRPLDQRYTYDEDLEPDPEEPDEGKTAEQEKEAEEEKTAVWASESNLLEVLQNPVDWSERKKELYRLDYLGVPFYEEFECPVPDWKMNLPQILYDLTGAVMPRLISRADDSAEDLVKAGMDPALAKGLEYCLRFALDVQFQSRMDVPLSQDSEWRPDPDPEPDDVPDADREAADRVEELQAKLKRQGELNAGYQRELYQTRKDLAALKEKYEKAQTQAAAERDELARLRELIFQQVNAEEQASMEKEETLGEKFPYMTQKRVVVFGGHDTWTKAIKPLLPNVVFVHRDQRPNADMIRAADVVWIQANALAHRSYYKIINVVRSNQIPVRYFGYASAVKCALQVLEDDSRRDG